MKTTSLSLRYLLIASVTLSSQSFAGLGKEFPDSPGHTSPSSRSGTHSWPDSPRPQGDSPRPSRGAGHESPDEEDDAEGYESDVGSYESGSSSDEREAEEEAHAAGDDDREWSSDSDSDSRSGSDEGDNASRQLSVDFEAESRRMQEQWKEDEARRAVQRQALDAQWEAQNKVFEEKKRQSDNREARSLLESILRSRMSVKDFGGNPDEVSGLQLKDSVARMREIITAGGGNPDLFPELSFEHATASQFPHTPDRSELSTFRDSQDSLGTGLTPAARGLNLSENRVSQTPPKTPRTSEDGFPSGQGRVQNAVQDPDSPPRPHRKQGVKAEGTKSNSPTLVLPSRPAREAVSRDRQPVVTSQRTSEVHEAAGTSVSASQVHPAARPAQPRMIEQRFANFGLRMRSQQVFEVCADGQNFHAVNTSKPLIFHTQGHALFSHEGLLRISEQLSRQFKVDILYQTFEGPQYTIVLFFAVGSNIPMAVLQHNGILMPVESLYQEPPITAQPSHYEELPESSHRPTKSSSQAVYETLPMWQAAVHAAGQRASQSSHAGRAPMPLPQQSAPALRAPRFQSTSGMAQIASGLTSVASGWPAPRGAPAFQPRPPFPSQPVASSQGASQEESENKEGKKKPKKSLLSFFGLGGKKEDKKDKKDPKGGR